MLNAVIRNIKQPIRFVIKVPDATSLEDDLQPVFTNGYPYLRIGSITGCSVMDACLDKDRHHGTNRDFESIDLKYTKQYFFGTERAIQLLKRI